MTPPLNCTVNGRAAVAVAAAVALAALVWLALGLRHPGDPAPSTAPSGGSARAPEDGDPSVGSDALARAEVAAPTDEPARAGINPLPVFPADRGRGSVFGEVLDENGTPVAGVAVTARPHLGNFAPMMVLADDRTTIGDSRTDADGRFSFDDLEEGPTLVAATDERGHRGAEIVIVRADRSEGPVGVRLLPSRTEGDDLNVTVVDGATGEPIPGATVELFAWSRRNVDAVSIARSATEPRHTATTDDAGTARVGGLALQSGAVFAHAADGRRGWQPLPPSRSDPIHVRIELTPTGSVQGVLRGLPPDALGGAVVSLHASWTRSPYHSFGGRRIDAPVRDGRFAFEELAPGTYGISLAAPSGARLAADVPPSDGRRLANAVVMPEVSVPPGEAVTIALDVTRGGRIEGLVTSAGRPVAGARVRSVIAPRTSNFPAGFVLHGVQVWRLDGPYENGPRNPTAFALTTTDGNGRYVLDGLQPGSHRLEVAADGMSFDRRLDVEVRDGVTSEQHHELAPAGVLQVAVLDATYVGVRPLGETLPAAIAITRNDCATFPGLAAGSYEVCRYHSDSRVAPVPLGVGEIVAGRTTWLDLRADSVASTITGRVLAGAQPIEGARVSLGSREASVTDAGGAFRVEAGYAIHFRGGFGARLRVRSGSLLYVCVPATADPIVSADLTIQLGTRFLDVVARDASGAPASAVVGLEVAPDESVPTIVRSVSGSVRIPADGRVRIGPLPDGAIRGGVEFADGFRIPFEIAPAQSPLLDVQRPATGTVRVRVVRDGRPVPRAGVHVRTWLGDGPAPESDEDFAAKSIDQYRRADDGGIAELTVHPGPLLVSVSAGFMSQVTQRADVAAAETVEIVVDLR